MRASVGLGAITGLPWRLSLPRRQADRPVEERSNVRSDRAANRLSGPGSAGKWIRGKAINGFGSCVLRRFRADQGL